jgi:transposase
MLEKKSCSGGFGKREAAAEKLKVTLRSIKRYLCRFRESGPEGLYDQRRSNYEKITEKDERQIVLMKLQGPRTQA